MIHSFRILINIPQPSNIRPAIVELIERAVRQRVEVLGEGILHALTDEEHTVTVTEGTAFVSRKDLTLCACPDVQTALEIAAALNGR